MAKSFNVSKPPKISYMLVKEGVYKYFDMVLSVTTFSKRISILCLVINTLRITALSFNQAYLQFSSLLPAKERYLLFLVRSISSMYRVVSTVGLLEVMGLWQYYYPIMFVTFAALHTFFGVQIFLFAKTVLSESDSITGFKYKGALSIFVQLKNVICYIFLGQILELIYLSLACTGFFVSSEYIIPECPNSENVSSATNLVIAVLSISSLCGLLLISVLESLFGLDPTVNRRNMFSCVGCVFFKVLLLLILTYTTSSYSSSRSFMPSFLFLGWVKNSLGSPTPAWSS